MSTRLNFKEHQCTNALSRFVRRYVTADGAFKQRYSTTIAPTGYAYLIWIVSGSFQARRGNEILINCAAPTILLGGVLEREPIHLECSGPFHEVIVEFTATGLFELLGQAGSEIAGIGLPIEAIQTAPVAKHLHKFAAEVSNQRVDHAPDARVATLSAVLSKMTVNAIRVPRYLSSSVERLEETHGACKISDLAKTSGVSAAHLRRKFSQIVGLSPKSFARLLMFNRAMEQLLADSDPGQVKAWAHAGYFDQSHLINTVKRVTGSNLRAHISRETPFPEELYRRTVLRSRDKN